MAKFLTTAALPSVLISSFAAGQTPEQQQIYDEASNNSKPVSDRGVSPSYHVFVRRIQRQMHSIVRAQCVNAGATQAQLQLGDVSMALGDTKWQEANLTYLLADSMRVVADVEYADGYTMWINGLYSQATPYFVRSAHSHDQAELFYVASSVKWDGSVESAKHRYFHAWNEFSELFYVLYMFG